MSSSTGSFARGDSLGADAFSRLDDLMEATGPSARARGGGATGRSSAGASATTGASSGGNRLRGTLESLELAVRDHGHAIEVMRRDIASLMDEKDRLRALLQAQDDHINARLSSEITAVKEEMNHRFSLQAAENKRLQAQVCEREEGRVIVYGIVRCASVVATVVLLWPPVRFAQLQKTQSDLAKMVRVIEGMSARLRDMELEVGMDGK